MLPRGPYARYPAGTEFTTEIRQDWASQIPHSWPVLSVCEVNGASASILSDGASLPVDLLPGGP